MYQPGGSVKALLAKTLVLWCMTTSLFTYCGEDSASSCTTLAVTPATSWRSLAPSDERSAVSCHSCHVPSIWIATLLACPSWMVALIIMRSMQRGFSLAETPQDPCIRKPFSGPPRNPIRHLISLHLKLRPYPRLDNTQNNVLSTTTHTSVPVFWLLRSLTNFVHVFGGN